MREINSFCDCSILLILFGGVELNVKLDHYVEPTYHKITDHYVEPPLAYIEKKEKIRTKILVHHLH